MTQIICFFGKLMFLFKSRKIPANQKKILIIRSGSIGDVLMTTPLIRAIRSKYTKARISYLTGNWSKDVLKGNKNINEIISVDDSVFFNKRIFEIISLIRKIKRKKFDLCFILDKSYLLNLFAYFCNIPFRIGFDRKGEGFANNLNVTFDGSKYELGYYLNIARLIKAPIKNRSMELILYKKDLVYSDKLLKKVRLKKIGIAAGGAENPGQKMHIKRWPKEKYIELVKRLLRKKYYIMLFGGNSDKKLNNDIVKALKSKNVVSVAGNSLQESAALMKKMNLFITHDSGSLHLAAAAGVKIIALFGPTDSKRFAPVNAIVIKSKLKCCPCYDIYGGYKKCGKSCMDNITVKEVLSKV